MLTQSHKKTAEVTEDHAEVAEDSLRDLYEQSGFRQTRVVPTESPFSVIEGVRA